MLVMFFYIMTTGGVFADHPESSSEDNIKAAYLFNFAKFVEWPPGTFQSDTEPIHVCVMGDDSLADTLEALENKTVGGRRLVVEHEQKPLGIHDCHIVYVGDSLKKKLPDILNSIRHKPVLTVSGMEDFAMNGGMIGFVRKGKFIRFEVNLKGVRNSGLTISSRLLKLAVIIEEDRGGR